MIEESSNTLWCGNLADQVTEELLYELFLQVSKPENEDYFKPAHLTSLDLMTYFTTYFLQAGPLEKVRIAKERDGRQKNFAFITYCHEVSIPYALELFRGTSLFNKALLLTFRGRMPYLPAPIRCHGPDSINLQSHDMEQFANMAQNLNDEVMGPVLVPRQNNDSNNLVLASLLGNWSHRHHPYQGKDMHRSRPHEFELRKSQRSSDSKKQSWNTRRNNRRGYRD